MVACRGAEPPSAPPEGSRAVSFPSADGVRLAGRLIGEGSVAVVLSHMRPADQRSWWSFSEDLADAGYLVLTYDFRGYCPGGVGGCSAGERDLGEIWRDVLGAIDFVRSRGARRVVLIGASMGGIIGSMFAGVDERVKAPVFLVAGGDWKILMEKSTLSVWRDAGRNNPQQMQEALRVMDVVDPVHWVGRIAPRPVLFINGDADDVVPVESNKALHNAAGEPKKIVWYKGGHVPPPTDWLTVISEVTNWLNTHLQGKPVARGWRDYLPRLGSWRELTDWLASVAPAVAAFFREFSATLYGYLSPRTR